MSDSDNQNKDTKKLPNFLDYTNDYLNDYLPNNKLVSKYTIANIKSTLRLFTKYIFIVKKIKFNDFKFSDCTPELIREWLDYEQETNDSSISTRNQKLIRLREYVYYVSTNKDSLVSSVYLKLYNIPMQRSEKKIKEVLTEQQVKLIIDSSKDLEINGKYKDRNWVILFLLFETAIRVSELVDIKLSDLVLNTEEPNLHILGKGKKHRSILLKQDTVNILKKYCSRYHNNSCDDSPLFYSLKNGIPGKLTTRNIQKIVKQCSDAARLIDKTIPNSVYPHMFRRSKATELYQSGAPIELVSHFLGHNQIDTTTIYAQPSNEQLRNSIENVNSKLNWDNNTGEDFDTNDLLSLLKNAGL